LDDEKLERIAARMREVGERTDLLIYERLRIAARQTQRGSTVDVRDSVNGLMLASQRSRRPLRTASTAAGAIFKAEPDREQASIDPAADIPLQRPS
jgi:hypothetical protein